METIQSSQLLSWLSRMLLIRRFEEAVVQLHKKGLVPGHPLVYIGQEATAVAVSDCLAPTDSLYATHRNHGHLLARGADPSRVLAEVLGRGTGYNRGRGGSMHPVVVDLGIYHTSAMVGASVALASGSALAAKQRGSGQISMACFGDGVLEEGIFYETINIAALWKLPVVYLCENNSFEALGVAGGESPSSTLAAARLTDLPAAFGLATAVVNGADPVAVHRAVSEAVTCARRGDGPSFVEARTVRWAGNRVLWPELVTGETDITMAWKPERIPQENQAWFTTHDPLLRLVRELMKAGAASSEVLGQIDGEVRAKIEHAIRFAIDSPFPDPESALDNVLAARGTP